MENLNTFSCNYPNTNKMEDLSDEDGEEKKKENVEKLIRNRVFSKIKKISM